MWWTADEWADRWRAQAVEAIRLWEGLIAKGASPEECRIAETAVFWAIWSYPKKPFDLDGKRYKGISRATGATVSVAQTPERRRARKKGIE